MGLFRRRRPRPVEPPWIEVSCGGEFPLEVRGESFHQPLLRELVKKALPEINEERIHATFKVALRREPENAFDSNAVAVLTLTGGALGHIPREVAAAYSGAMATTEGRFQLCCNAAAYGRRTGRDWNIGIWLAVPDADQLTILLAEAVSNSGPHVSGETLARG
jgi:hypothetical protein